VKENRTRIAIVLDRSGSMASVRESTVTGFNEFIRKQREVGGDVSVKLIQFDDQYEVVFDKSLGDVPELNQSNFVPRGGTALYDAQGKTIISIGEELAAMSEDERPSKVIIMTLTDGQENSSREYTLAMVSAVIKEQREKYNWDFVFLGANQDAVKTAGMMNIPRNSAMTYSSNPTAMRASMAMASNYVNLSRTCGAASFSEQDRISAMVPDLGGSGSIVGGKSQSLDEIVKRSSIL
jgi:uncharacterized protein YegL